MNDAFLIGAGFSKAVCPQMPTMKQLYERLRDSADDGDGITEEEYNYAAGDVEGLLSEVDPGFRTGGEVRVPLLN